MCRHRIKQLTILLRDNYKIKQKIIKNARNNSTDRDNSQTLITHSATLSKQKWYPLLLFIQISLKLLIIQIIQGRILINCNIPQNLLLFLTNYLRNKTGFVRWNAMAQIDKDIICPKGQDKEDVSLFFLFRLYTDEVILLLSKKVSGTTLNFIKINSFTKTEKA